MKLFFLPIFMAFLTFASASSVIGYVKKVEGSVKVQSENSLKKKIVKSGFEIKSGDLITTSEKSTAVVKLVDGSVLVLDVSSTLHFSSEASAEHQAGRIYYKITSRDATNSLKIKTPFAIIGIKGTTFIVDAKENSSVILKEGVIGIQSIKEEFELYRKKVQAEFSSYVSEQQSEYEKFKNEQNKYAVAESRKEFDLEAGNRVSFNENKVNEDAFNADDEAEFSYFEKLINPSK